MNYEMTRETYTPTPQAFEPSCSIVNLDEVSPYHVSCAKNPKDLRPVTDMILARTLWALENTDGPVVVLFGEKHDAFSHTELQHHFASRLHNMGHKFTFNVEDPFNSIEEIAGGLMGKPFPEHLTYCASDHDHDGKGILSAFLGFRSMEEAPIAHNNLFAFCYKNNIPFQFNDAADEGSFLDMMEPHNRRFVKEYKGPETGFGVEDPDGMAVRNRIMVHRALSFAEKWKTRLILQKAGGVHLFGYSSGKMLYEDSLCALFEGKGVYVVPVFPFVEKNGYGIDFVPEEACEALSQSIIHSGLDDRTFVQADFFVDSSRETDAILEVQKESGNETSFTDVYGNRGHYQERAAKHRDEIIARAEEELSL